MSNYGFCSEFLSIEMHSSGLLGMQEDAADKEEKLWEGSYQDSSAGS